MRQTARVSSSQAALVSPQAQGARLHLVQPQPTTPVIEVVYQQAEGVSPAEARTLLQSVYIIIRNAGRRATAEQKKGGTSMSMAIIHLEVAVPVAGPEEAGQEVKRLSDLLNKAGARVDGAHAEVMDQDEYALDRALDDAATEAEQLALVWAYRAQHAAG